MNIDTNVKVQDSQGRTLTITVYGAVVDLGIANGRAQEEAYARTFRHALDNAIWRKEIGADAVVVE